MRLFATNSFRLSIVLLSIPMMLACADEAGGDSSTATVEGRVTETDGAQPRSFGGEGTLEGASNVQASEVDDDGSLILVAEADVEADGRYTIDVPANRENLVIQAIGAEGEVLAAAILERSGAEGETVACTPMDSESSLEAAVLVEMIARAEARTEVNVADLRARIDTGLAVAVRAAAATGDAAQSVRGLALAILAAQRTEIGAYAEAGVSVTQRELYEAGIEASRELSAALHAGDDAAEAHASFLAALDAIAEARDLDAEDRARAESSAGVSFRATARANMSADSWPLEEALLSAAALEARAQAQATETILTAGSAGSAVISAGVNAGAELRSDLRSANTIEAAIDAYAELGAELRGDADVSGSVLGSYLGVDATSQAGVEAAVMTSATAAATLDAALEAAFEASLSTAGEVDTEALANDVVAAYAAYYGAVEAGTDVIAAQLGEASAGTSASLLIVADGSFRSSGR